MYYDKCNKITTDCGHFAYIFLSSVHFQCVIRVLEPHVLTVHNVRRLPLPTVTRTHVNAEAVSRDIIAKLVGRQLSTLNLEL